MKDLIKLSHDLKKASIPEEEITRRIALEVFGELRQIEEKDFIRSFKSVSILPKERKYEVVIKLGF